MNIEKLQLFYYELLTCLSPQQTEDIYERLTCGMNEQLDTDFIGIYLFDSWTKRFSLVSQSARNQRKVLLNNIVEDQVDTYRTAIMDGTMTLTLPADKLFIVISPDINYKVITLKPAEGPAGLLVLGYEAADVTWENCVFIKQETEKVLSYVFLLDESNWHLEKNQYLFEITSTFFMLNNKTDILMKIIASLRDIYPSFRFYLLLSQDHDEVPGLPIKSLKYGDESTKLVSSQAFINGTVQIEDRLHDQSTCVYAPLKGLQGVYGVIQIVSQTFVEFPSKEIDFISKFANAAGKAIENTTLYQNSTHLVSDLKLLNDITHQLNSNLELTGITNLVKHQIIQMCNASEIGFVYRMQEITNQFEVLEGSTAFFQSVEGRGFVRLLVEEALAKKESIFSGDYNNSHISLPFRSVMVIPMENSGLVNGLVIVLGQNPYSFTFDTFKLLQSIIRHSTLAFVNTILKEQLQKAAATDYLTQLFSRSYLDEKIMQHMGTGEMGTLILFDIDDFKKVNDTYGHYIGDGVIKQVADIIMSSIGEQDVPARWGGEELAIYLPSTDLNEGVHVARNINNQVENFTEPRVTLSAGVSSWSMEEADSAKDFFVRADKALYEAKSFGKNCVVKYGRKEQKVEEADETRLL